jgi:diguanylate cyclase (GGDEF)-like protein/PAS domain S-box-containing protein
MMSTYNMREVQLGIEEPYMRKNKGAVKAHDAHAVAPGVANAIPDSEDRFHAFMHNSPAIVFMKDREGRFTYLNAEFLRRMVPSGQNWIGKTNFELFPTELTAQLNENDQRVWQDGKVHEYIESKLDSSGRLTHWLAHKFLFRDHTGREYLAVQAIDITERLEAEQAIRKSRQRLKAALAASHTGIYFWNVRTNAVEVDEGCEYLFGCQASELATLDQFLSTIHPEDRPDVAHQVELCLSKDQGFDMDFRIVLPNGQVRTLHSKGEFYLEAGGKPEYFYGACIDITDRKLSERALAESQRFATSTVDALAAHIAILDESGRILAVNQAWRQFAADNHADPDAVGVGRNYLEDCESSHFYDGDDAHAVTEGIRSVIRGDQERFSMEYRCDSPNEKRWFVLRVSRFGGDGPVRVVLTHENVTERRLVQERLRHDSLHDALTGLPNRTQLDDRINRCIERTRKDSSYHFALFFLDLDRFKIINDSLGYVAGDKVLMMIGSRLRDCVRIPECMGRDGPSTVARFTGNEFAVLLEEVRHPEDIVCVAQHLLAEISRPLMFDGHEIISTASIGIVTESNGSTGAAPNANDLVRDADIAMNCAKSRGKNQYARFDAGLNKSALTRLSLESDLRHALERHELLLHYQPIISLATRELEGFEALIRWRRDGKLISPAEFIPIAEEAGLILPIGQWVLEESCRQLVIWRAQHLELPHLYVSINVSRRQLNDHGFVSQVADALRNIGANPADVRLEITETVIMENNKTAKQTMDQLKQIGVLLSMDDFGTGYSSLSCLRNFPIDVLKIDRSFLANLTAQTDAATVISAVVSLAHDMKITVVAEGLESFDQVVILKAMGCDSGQGYCLGKPMPYELAAQFIKTHPLNVPPLEKQQALLYAAM